MLMVNQLLGFGVGGGSTAAGLTVTNTDETNAGFSASSSQTFSSLSFGAAEAGRLIIVAISHWDGGGTPKTISSVQIAGGAATELLYATQPVSDFGAGLGVYARALDTGTSGNVSMVFSDAPNGVACAVWSVLGGASITPHDTLTDSGNPISGALDIPAGGVAIAHAHGRDSGSTVAWTGLAEDYESDEGYGGRYSGASAAFTSEETGRTITATYGSPTTKQIMGAVSLGLAV